MTAAAAAAQRGARVVVLEKAPRIGGSAAMSEGYIWTAPDLETLVGEDREVDRQLAEVLLAEFPAALGWVRGMLPEQRPVSGIIGFGRGAQIDIHAYFRKCQASVESSGGWVLPNTEVLGLLLEDGQVRGVQTGEVKIEAEYTLIATGGFQGSPEMINEYIGPTRPPLFLRSNPTSVGDGIRLGLSAGGALSGGMAGFYGHVMPSPLNRAIKPSEYTAFTQYHSTHSLLLDMQGRRFTDESLGDHISAQDIARLPGGRAILIADERIRREQVLQAFIPGMDKGLDKFELAASAGANHARADDFVALADAVASWGPPAEQTLANLREYNAAVAGHADAVRPPRKRFRKPLVEPPFVALEVQAAITFTYGGLRTDADAHVLDGSGRPIPGLLAAGVDAGGLYRRGFAGGLVRGLVFGLRAGKLVAQARTT